MSDPNEPSVSGPPRVQAYGHAQPTVERPKRSVGWVVLAIVGGLVFVFMLLAWLGGAHNGYVNAFAMAVFVVGGWLMLATGALATSRARTRTVARRLGSLVIVTVLTVTGPTLSTGFARSSEERKFAELAEAATDPTIDLHEWEVSYEKVDPKFRRAGWRRAWMLARVQQAGHAGDTAELESILDVIDDDDTYTDAASAARALLETSDRESS